MKDTWGILRRKFNRKFSSFKKNLNASKSGKKIMIIIIPYTIGCEKPERENIYIISNKFWEIKQDSQASLEDHQHDNANGHQETLTIYPWLYSDSINGCKF